MGNLTEGFVKELKKVPSLDRADVLSRLDGDSELCQEILVCFLEDFPKRFEELETALKDNNQNKIKMIAHALKGAARNVGAKAFAEVALRMETAVKENNSELGDLCSLLKSEWNTLSHLARENSALQILHDEEEKCAKF